MVCPISFGPQTPTSVPTTTTTTPVDGEEEEEEKAMSCY